MMHMDLNTTNAIIAARQEAVQKMMLASRRQDGMMSRIGMFLIWLGEKLQQDVRMATPAHPEVPVRKRPQVA